MLYNNSLFDNCEKNKNRKVSFIKIDDLISFDICIPDLQRLKNNEKIKEIVDIQDLFYKKNSRFNFQGTLNIHCCLKNGKNYLIDGQHRYFSIKELVEKHKYIDERILVELVLINDLEDLKENYKMINKNTILPELPDNLDKKPIEELCDYIYYKYPDFWSNSCRPMRPKLYHNHFIEALGYLSSKLNELDNKEITFDELKDIIMKKNEDIMKSDFKFLNKLKTKEKMIQKCKEYNFYLGLYLHKSTDYCYMWIKEILDEKKKKYEKKTIPKKLREQVWDKYIGNIKNSICLCCKSNVIKVNDFHCGHIIAEKNEGKTIIDNLRPICKSCNSSMGTRNLKTFAQDFYATNVL